MKRVMTEVFSYLLPLTTYLFLSCSDGKSSSDPAPGPTPTPAAAKEVIAFSGNGTGFTRASMTRAGFEHTTKIVARIKAEGAAVTDVRYTQTVLTAAQATTADDECNDLYGLKGTHSHLTYVTGKERFWDDAFGRASKLTVYALAIPENGSPTKLTDTFLDQTGGTAVDATKNPNWYTIGTENTEIDWDVSTKQTAVTRADEDLAYSNNIREGEGSDKGRYHQKFVSENNWSKSMELGCMIWQSENPNDPSVTVGKYDQGHLVFHHALAWIEINIKEGGGFDRSKNTDFTWTNKPADCAQNITLTGFNTSGKLDISSGTWSDMTSQKIIQLDDQTGMPRNETIHNLHAYVLPGTDLYNNTSNVISFEIDEGKYSVTGKQIANAIREFHSYDGGHYNADYAGFTTIEAGKHYIINLKVGKREIDNITAAILDWEEVNSTDIIAKNTDLTFTFEDRGTRLTGDDAAKFDIYRAKKKANDYITANTESFYDWETGYDATPATKNWVADHWNTNLYWEDSKTYCHFRAAGTATASGRPQIKTDATRGDYFEIASGEIDANGSSYKDYVWGAPFTFVDNRYLLNYDNTNGFAKKKNNTYQIAPGIPATFSQIHMLLFHMTSQIFVNVKTTTDGDKVTLYDNNNTPDDTSDDKYTKVEIINFLPNGKVLMGTGVVSATDGTRATAAEMTRGTFAAASGTEPDRVIGFSYGIVPQPLSWTGGTIGLRITTPEGNEYIVSDLSTCTATVSTTNLQNPYTLAPGLTNLYTIDAWYPHYKYTYTITIKKTGTQYITAAVLPWETVEGDLGTITLEN